jgi:esterase/lipase
MSLIRCILVTMAFSSFVPSMSRASQWFYSQDSKPRAVALVAHGLNMNPTKMDALAQLLASKGVDAYRIGLSGHEGDLDIFKAASREKWRGEMISFSNEAAARAAQFNVPLYLVGFSLGATLAEDAMNGANVTFDKAVLFAPAMALKFTSKLIRAYRIFGKRACVPSAAPREYRANKCTPVCAYTALFDSIKAGRATGLAKSNIPTLIFVDPKDELVSLHGLESMSRRFDLNQWRFVEVFHKNSKLKRVVHHLITDEDALGAEPWAQVVSEISKHLDL